MTLTILKKNSKYGVDFTRSGLTKNLFPIIATTIGILLLPSTSLAATMKMDVSTLGKKLGVLQVDDYTGGKGFMGLIDDDCLRQFEPEKCKKYATASITANFTEMTDEKGKEILRKWAPQGLTFMQTIKFTSDKQQKIFRDMDGNILKETFSDPPWKGYTLPGGERQGSNDMTPWYSTLEPAMVPGASPPVVPEFFSQFADDPTIRFPDYNDPQNTEGLANLLNGKNGMWSFETALVGVKEKPQDNSRTGKYKVIVLKTFTWGLNFEFTGNALDGLTAEDYTVTAKELKFGTKPSDDFMGAFDQKGNNKDVEWNVMFVKHTPEPTSTLSFLFLGSLGAASTLKRKLKSSKKKELEKIA